MRFVANENFPLAAVRILRKAGHDISSISELSPGITDQAVLEIAHREQRIVLTFDRELLYLRALPNPAGLVYFRCTPATPEAPAQQVLALCSRDDLHLEGNFIVIDPTLVRVRPLPVLPAA